jgi:hypothetical protein
VKQTRRNNRNANNQTKMYHKQYFVPITGNTTKKKKKKKKKEAEIPEDLARMILLRPSIMSTTYMCRLNRK